MRQRQSIVLFILLVLCILSAFKAYGAVSDYTFSSTLDTYSYLAGGTELGTSANDDESFNAIPLGFPFYYDGTRYTQVSVQTDGYLAFGPTVINNTMAIAYPAGTNNVVCAMNRDLMGGGVGTLSYLLSGTAPNRVFTVQWQNYRRINTGAEMDALNFQIQLHENGYLVKFSYNVFILADITSARTYQVGLRGVAAADFHTRATTTDWTATTAGALNTATCTITNTVYPPPGLLFTFTPSVLSDPRLVIYPPALDFGTVEVGQSKDLTLTLYANGPAGQSLIIDQANFTYGSIFDILNLPGLPYTMNVGESLALNVRFAPSNRYDQTDVLNLQVSTSTVEMYSVSMHGMGHISPWTVDPPFYSFGAGSGNSTPMSASFTINVNLAYGMSTIMLEDLSVSGDAAFYNPQLQDSFGSPLTLPAMVMLGNPVYATVLYSNADIAYHQGSLNLYVYSAGDTLSIPICANDAVLATDGGYSFGLVEPGTSSNYRLNFWVTGAVDSSLVITDATLTGDYQFSWSWGATPPVPMPLSVGDMQYVDITYSPDFPGSHNAVVAFYLDDGTQVTVWLDGFSDYALPPFLTVNPTSWDFGTVNVGSFSGVSVNLYADGTGTGTLSIESIYTTGDMSFSVVPPISPPFTMMAGETVTVAVSFTPLVSELVSGDLVIVWNGTQIATVPLSGNGYMPTASLSVSPSILPFGDVEIFNSAYQTVTLTATGDPGAQIEVQSLDLVGDTQYSLFNPPTTPFTMTVPQEVLITVEFLPTDAMPYYGTLTVTDGNAATYPVQLMGSGFYIPMASWLEPSPSSLDFATVELGTFSQLPLNLYAYGDPYTPTPVTVDSLVIVGSADFQASPDYHFIVPFQIAVGEFNQITVTYTPSTTGLANASLYVYYDSSQLITIPLAGNGLQTVADLQITPLSVDFGYVALMNTGYQEVLLTATGPGTASITITDLMISGGAEFSVFSAPPTPFTINAPQSVSVTLAFTPAGMTGPYWATFTVYTGVTSYPVSLTGQAFLPPTQIVADFVGTPLIGHAPLAVQFTDTSTVDPFDPISSIEGWRWDFDLDGSIDSYAQNPLHVYSEPGVYSVKMTAISYTGQVYECLKENYVSVGNIAPVVAAGAPAVLSFNEDTIGGPWPLAAMFYDADGDTLYYAVSGSEHISPEIVTNSQLRLHPSENWYGTESIGITAIDPYGSFAEHTISVTVLPVNDPPVLDIPPDMYFIHNSDYTVDFAQYISDPDNIMNHLSLTLEHIAGPGDITYVYLPINAPNVPGQFLIKFSTPQQNPMQDTFRLTVNDNAGRAIAQTVFIMHLIVHFEPLVQLGDLYQFAGQTVLFYDATLGNPDWWIWTFGDTETGTTQDPQHTYPLAGTYDISLTLGNTQANEQATVVLPALFTLVGTSVTPGNVPAVWDSLSSPYNLFGNVQIPGDLVVNILPNVEINLFGDDPLQISGTLNATRARFRPQGGSSWGGLKFLGDGNFREPSSLTDCDILDAELPVDIIDSSPNLSGINIALTDTTGTLLMEGPGLMVTGSSAPVINDLEISNYCGGLVIDSDGTADRTTPTLSNIRVRNSNESSRFVPEASIGASIYCDVSIDSLEIANFATGLMFSGGDRDRTSTPTLSYIRVRNSDESSRSILLGMRISGDIAPVIDNLDISGVNNGIRIEAISGNRSTPTLSNIRIQNSNESSRSEDYGIGIEDIGPLMISNGEILGFYHGVRINNSENILGTPTLSNIRIRNSDESSRQENIGLEIHGPVAITLTGSRIEDYPIGIKYIGSGRGGVPSAKITNTVVRNTLPQRLSSIGMQLHDLGRIVCRDDSIGGFNVGMEVMNDSPFRDYSLPSLNNLTLAISEENIRFDNVGIFLGPRVGGTLAGCDINGAKTGIFIADGNLTTVNANRVRNCEVGVKGASANVPKSISHQEVILEQAFALAHQTWDFHAFDISLAGPWTVHNNTVVGYPKLLMANNTNAAFLANIGWGQAFLSSPFTITNSSLTVNYNDLYTAQPWTGTANINADPGFLDPALMDYNIGYASPCVDAGDPFLPLDPDGSVCDIGAHFYPHRSDLTAGERFVQTGTTVVFTNTSIGHDFPFTTVGWDLNADGSIESSSRDWQYTFNAPGMYNIRLIMTSGPLQDIRTYNAYIVAQSNLLQAPQNVQITMANGMVELDWDPVQQTQDGDPITVEHYIVYRGDVLDEYFDFVGYTTNFLTQYSHTPDPLAERGFYVVLGYAGSLRQMMDFINANRRIKLSTQPLPAMRNSKE